MNQPRAQRRLAAILAADVVGYSRMMREDETGTLAQLKTLRKEVFDPRIAEHNGRIVKTTGDGVLVEFASAVDATECAIKVQRALARRNEDVPEGHRIELRIGINLGDIIVDGDDIYGDGVNVAARLEGLCDTGEVYVSAVVHDQVEGKIEAAFDDLGEHMVKNIDKPLRVYRVPIWTALSATTKTETYPNRSPDLPDKPSIAVLPFDNMSGDPEQEYFSDGIAEDIITDLSKLSGLFVIARNSSFAYKGKAVHVKEVAQELGVRHVLEGSVRKAGNRVRINSQLIDATTGGHLWAERYDGDIEDIFALQDEITAKIVSALKVSLSGRENERATGVPTEDMEVYDLFLRGRAAMFPTSKGGLVRARQLLEEVIERDPALAEAHVLLGYAYLSDWAFVWCDEPGLDAALQMARRAIALDDTLAIAHGRLGWMMFVNGEHDEAVAELKQAIELDPNYADGYHWLGEALNYLGDPAGGMEEIRKAMRLSPHLHGAHLGHSNFLLRRYDDATATLKEGIARAPGFPLNYLYLAIVYSELDQKEEAQTQITSLLGLVPKFTLAIFRERWVQYRNQSDTDRFFDGLRKAGLPE